MHLTLLLTFSIFLFASCGKHEQENFGRQGVANTTQVNSLSALSQNIVEEDIAALTKYIKDGEDIDAELSNGRTLITEACFWSKFKVIELLVSHKVNLSKIDKNGQSAIDYGEKDIIIKRALFPELLIELKRELFLATMNNQITDMRRILEENISANFFIQTVEIGPAAEQFDGETLLTFIIINKLENPMRLLAQPKYELDVNQKNAQGESPLFLAKKFHYTNIERLLIRLGATE